MAWHGDGTLGFLDPCDCCSVPKSIRMDLCFIHKVLRFSVREHLPTAYPSTDLAA